MASHLSDRMEWSWGEAQHTVKGEDAAAVVVDATGDVAFFGVFDGHGGANLAKALARKFPKRLLGARTPAEVIDAYYDVDAELGPVFFREGSTAACAVVERDSSESVFSSTTEREKTTGSSSSRACGGTVTLSWVGDSKIVEVDMLSRKLLFETDVHHVSNPSERERVELQTRLRRGEPMQNLLDDISAKHMDDDDANAAAQEVLKRATEYERRVAAADESSGHGLARASSTIGRRALKSSEGESVEGPLVIQTNWRTARGVTKKGASTQVTRSMGDYDSARVLVPHPEVLARTFSTDAVWWRRYVIASDGLWDVLTADKVRRVVAGVETPRQAAAALVVAARSKYRSMRPDAADPFKDDTTVVCFDVKHGSAFARTFDRSFLFCILKGGADADASGGKGGAVNNRAAKQEAKQEDHSDSVLLHSSAATPTDSLRGPRARRFGFGLDSRRDARRDVAADTVEGDDTETCAPPPPG